MPNEPKTIPNYWCRIYPQTTFWDCEALWTVYLLILWTRQARILVALLAAYKDNYIDGNCVISCGQQTVLSAAVHDLTSRREDFDKGIEFLCPIDGRFSIVIVDSLCDETLMFLVSEGAEDDFFEELLETILLFGDLLGGWGQLGESAIVDTFHQTSHDYK